MMSTAFNCGLEVSLISSCVSKLRCEERFSADTKRTRAITEMPKMERDHLQLLLHS